MNSSITVQNRELTLADIHGMQALIAAHPDWSRYRLSREICKKWGWENGKGQIKDIACRSLMRKLDRSGHIQLPPCKVVSPNRYRHEPVSPVDHDCSPIWESLAVLSPVRCVRVDPATVPLFEWLLATYHYLGYRQPVGENVTYMAFDRFNRPLACLLFGAAAWKCEARDRFIGWSQRAHRQHLELIANNHRFLILPWVEVPHLASHLLAMACRRLARDWQDRYGHRIVLVETFVQVDRFAGTCYRAANWIRLGMTKGRSRNDRFNAIKVPVKAVYCYRLAPRALEVLCHED
jgi:hypothetical protein